MSMLFHLYGHEVVTANSPQAGLDILERQEIHLVIQDMNFSSDTTSGDEGKVLFDKVRLLFPDTPIILLTAWTHLEQAVELVKSGASDYLSKPWDDDRLVTTVSNLLQLQAAEASNSAVALSLEEERGTLETFDLCGIVFKSRAMLNLLQIATQVARADVPVLITGPNGVGKELFADIVHANQRAKGRWSKSMLAHCRQISLRANSLVPRPVPSPVPGNDRAGSRWLMGAPYFSMKSAICRSTAR